MPKHVWGWAFADFGNSSYVLVFQSFLLPVYFSTVLLAQGYSLGSWGIANAISTVLGIALSIFSGKYADVKNRLRTFKILVTLSFIGMMFVSLAIGYWPVAVYWLFILANMFFIATLSVSDSILPHVSDTNTTYAHSGFAWGFGYLGGIASLIMVIILQKLTGDYSASVFASVAIFYFIFSLYSARRLAHLDLNPDPVLDTTENLLPPKRLKTLFVGYWLMGECTTVVILFFSIFAAQELHLSTMAIGVSLLLVQLVAFPATYLGGVLAERKNPQTLLGITILIWGIIIATLVLFKSLIALGFVIFLAGLVLGNSQSYIRAQYSTLIKKSQSGLRFGFYSMVAQASVVIAPVAYGYASDYFHSQKIPIVIIYFLMVLGYFLARSAAGNAASRRAGAGAEAIQ
jgi:UMF1 family MFS transporter